MLLWGSRGAHAAYRCRAGIGSSLVTNVASMRSFRVHSALRTCMFGECVACQEPTQILGIERRIQVSAGHTLDDGQAIRIFVVCFCAVIARNATKSMFSSDEGQQAFAT